MKNYPLLDVRVSTPTLELRSATDELLDQLADVVRAGKTHADHSVGPCTRFARSGSHAASLPSLLGKDQESEKVHTLRS
jgi:hypothetical protein